MMARAKLPIASFRSGLVALCLLAGCSAMAQSEATPLPAEGATSQPETAQPPNTPPITAQPDTLLPAEQPAAEAAEGTPEPSATAAPAPIPEPPPETCRSVTDKAMAADLKALTAQTQKQEVSVLVQLHGVSAGFWTKAVELCDGRAKERAQRNLVESQKANALLSEQLGNGPECGAAHKDAGTLQDMARVALAERRWEDAATLFHKSEDMWDLATERCSGAQKELAGKRQEQAEIDGFNAEFCAPLFDRAREQTQKLRASSAGMSREEKQEGLMVAETLWREALSQCKGTAAQDSARNNAQALARERGTPWVARNPAPIPQATQAPKVAAPATKPAPVAVKPVEPVPPAKTAAVVIAAPPLQPPPAPAAPLPTASVTSGLVAKTPDAVSTQVSKIALAPQAVTPAKSAPAPAPLAAAPIATTAPAAQATGAATVAGAPAVEPAKPQPQPEEFAVDDMHFKGQFVRDADANTFSGKGKLRWANGDVFEGTLKMGKREGRGLFIWANGQRYQGDWINDVSTGQATVDFINGDHYEGAVEKATPKGLGSMRYASGDTYQGHFQAGEPHGSGTYLWKNGQRFEGDWKNGKANGQGKLHFANGDSYEGVVRDGKPDQFGQFTWASGEKYSGQWKAGLKEGQGTFSWTTGDRWEGVYENDQQTSNGTLIRKTP